MWASAAVGWFLVGAMVSLAVALSMTGWYIARNYFNEEDST